MLWISRAYVSVCWQMGTLLLPLGPVCGCSHLVCFCSCIRGSDCGYLVLVWSLQCLLLDARFEVGQPFCCFFSSPNLDPVCFSLGAPAPLLFLLLPPTWWRPGISCALFGASCILHGSRRPWAPVFCPPCSAAWCLPAYQQEQDLYLIPVQAQTTGLLPRGCQSLSGIRAGRGCRCGRACGPSSGRSQ